MRYGIVSFDTQAIETNQFRFNSGVLRELKLLRDSHIKVIISKVTVDEIKSRYAEKIKGAKESLNAAIAKAAVFGIISEDCVATLIDSTHFKEKASIVVDNFLQECGATVLDYSHTSLNRVMELYFHTQPPFSSSGKKKHEFPDAVALLSIENYAKKSGTIALLASGDQDWEKYCENSTSVYHTDKIQSLLDAVQTSRSEAADVIKSLIPDIFDESIKTVKSNEALFMIENEIEKLIPGLFFESTADSIFSVSGEITRQEYIRNSIHFLTPGDKINYLDISDKRISIWIEFCVEIRAEAEFSFGVYDSVDKDYANVGNALVTNNSKINFSASMSFLKDDSSNDFYFFDISIGSQNNIIDFGYVEPDREDDYDEYEELSSLNEDEMDEDIPF